MKQLNMIHVGIGDVGTSNTPGQLVKTFALGSCVALVMVHPGLKVVGMAHIALPESKISQEKAKAMPGYFADTAIPMLLAAMSKYGCGHNGRHLTIKLVGGANVMDPQERFNIGKRNALAIKKGLWKRGLGAVSEELGGSLSRTVTVAVDTCRVVLSVHGRKNWEI